MKLILPLNKPENNRVRYYARVNQMFDILKSYHIEIEHGGLQEMKNKSKMMYVNVTALLFQFFYHFYFFIIFHTVFK